MLYKSDILLQYDTIDLLKKWISSIRNLYIKEGATIFFAYIDVA